MTGRRTKGEGSTAIDEPGRMSAAACLCGEGDGCWFFPEYPWCRPCQDHHRPPECPIDQDGFGLAQCGCRWVDVENATGAHPSPACAWADA